MFVAAHQLLLRADHVDEFPALRIALQPPEEAFLGLCHGAANAVAAAGVFADINAGRGRELAHGRRVLVSLSTPKLPTSVARESLSRPVIIS